MRRWLPAFAVDLAWGEPPWLVGTLRDVRHEVRW
jgi:hypothetical protein